MPEKPPEQPDFSTPQGQKEGFFDVEESEQKKVIAEAREQAELLKQKVQSGEAGNYPEAEEIRERELEESKQEVIKCLIEGYVDFTPEEIVHLGAREERINLFSAKYIENIIKIKDRFHVPEEVIQEAAKEALISHLFKGYRFIGVALDMINKLYISDDVLSSPEVQDAAEYMLVDCLSMSDVNSAIKIKGRFHFQEQILFEAAKRGLINCLINGGYINDNVISEIIDEFLPSLSSQDLISISPEIQTLLSRLQESVPHLARQAERSLDVLFALFAYKDDPERLLENIREHPFLAGALEQNPRFGSKLLLKFNELDSPSQENIRFLFDAKKEILSGNPELDPESLEFRRLMQEKLKEYKENPEILDAIQRGGIDTEAWLDYGETRYFSLESGKETVAFSETIATPILRIKETIDSYAHRVKEVLKQYRAELSQFRVPLESQDAVSEKIAAMREEMEKARREGDDRKAQGIQKGIESLSKKLENPQTVALWDKTQNDINGFSQLKNDVHQAHEKLMAAERQFEDPSKMSGGNIIELKANLAKAKEEMRSKFAVLERRLEEFQAGLPTALAPCLSAERADALIQEMQNGMEEQFSHFRTDRTTLANLFSEKGDKDKEKMDDQPMSVFVWARNPDVDLYQANYSPCCISIERGYHADGGESTIADYTTDLGIQIVNIWDEAKNEPVTAAWCWLGEDAEGAPALVVDNIESNTLYSSHYPEQLTRELFAYLADYAQSIGAKKVVLGKSNNDLPTSGALRQMPDDVSAYQKIGGANRADGYYLEADGAEVKVVWDGSAETKKEGRAPATEKQKPIPATFFNPEVISLGKDHLPAMLELEEQIYEEDFIQGAGLRRDIKNQNGFAYSVALFGERKKGAKPEMIGYLAGVEDETDDGEPCIYMEDIAVAPQAQGQGLGWNLMQAFVEKLKTKARADGRPVLLSMHLLGTSQRLMERHRQELEQMGVTLKQEALEENYYDNGQDALYRVYEVAE